MPEVFPCEICDKNESLTGYYCGYCDRFVCYVCWDTERLVCVECATRL